MKAFKNSNMFDNNHGPGGGLGGGGFHGSNSGFQGHQNNQGGYNQGNQGGYNQQSSKGGQQQQQFGFQSNPM